MNKTSTIRIIEIELHEEMDANYTFVEIARLVQ